VLCLWRKSVFVLCRDPSVISAIHTNFLNTCKNINGLCQLRLSTTDHAFVYCRLDSAWLIEWLCASPLPSSSPLHSPCKALPCPKLETWKTASTCCMYNFVTTHIQNSEIHMQILRSCVPSNVPSHANLVLQALLFQNKQGRQFPCKQACLCSPKKRFMKDSSIYHLTVQFLIQIRLINILKALGFHMDFIAKIRQRYITWFKKVCCLLLTYGEALPHVHKGNR
jgi:hypothetical protein